MFFNKETWSPNKHEIEREERKMETKEIKEVKSDVGFVLSDVEKTYFGTLDLLNNVSRMEDYHELIKKKIDDIFTNYLEIGAALIAVEKDELFKYRGYKSIFDYAMDGFQLAETTVRNVMAVVNKFCEVNDRGYNIQVTLNEKYKDFSYSALVELLPLENVDLEVFKPSLSVKKIRDKKKILSFDKEFENLFKEKGFIFEVIKLIENYDYATAFAVRGFTASNKFVEIDKDENCFSSKVEISNKETGDKFFIEVEFRRLKLNLCLEAPKGSWIYCCEYNVKSFDVVVPFIEKIVSKLKEKDLITPEGLRVKEYKKQKEIASKEKKFLFMILIIF